MSMRRVFLVGLVLAAFSSSAFAQSTATLQGTVTDPSGAVVSGAKVTVRNQATGTERIVQTDSNGNYQAASLPPGVYQVEAQAQGFGPQAVSDLTLEVSRIVVQNFQLKLGDVTQRVEVVAGGQNVETATVTVGQVINQKTVQEIPLNGRHFVDLGLLIPGSVTPPQNGFLTAPLRGQGSFAFNTAGAREDTVNFMINGINLNDMVQNQITFQPSINTVQEFKVDNSTYSAEYGRNSGAIVNIATRSGTNEFHGEGFEFIRNDIFDARNFFDRCPAANPNCEDGGRPPFKRNQFGAALGGPIYKNRAFFFFSYEGLRQRQGLTLNGNVLTDAQRASVTDPTVARLVDLIPRPTSVDVVNGVAIARFQGSGTAPVDLDQWTGDVSYNLGSNDQLHFYYAIQRDERGEPNLQGNTIPGFGDTRKSRRQILTLNETHTFNSNLVNEARLGFNRIFITFTPNAQLNPADFGIVNGINDPIGLPQINVAGFNLNFGGPNGFPQGRGDVTGVLSDTLSYLRGRHSFKFGGELRRFYNNNFARTIGSFGFANINDFLNGRANAFTANLGNQSSSIAQGALGFFAQDGLKVKPNFTLELGLRYDWFMTPSERYDRFVIFDPVTNSLNRVGAGIDDVYQANHVIQPRIGFAWDPFKDGKTSIRAGYAILGDQPVTNLITGASTNAPLADPRSFSPPSSNPGLRATFSNALAAAAAVGLAPTSVDGDFENAYVQSWNLNVQREITPSLGVTIGYFGSKGTQLRIQRNINQFRSGARVFTALSSNSPILANTRLGNIFESGSAGNSNYNALWLTANKRLSRGLQFNASYTFSKSIDYNSLNTQGVVVQDSFNIRGDRGLSDFDARHRFVINWLYELPFKGNRLVEGWQFSSITQLQSGNPVNLVFNDSTLTGTVTNQLATLRPDLIGPITILEDPNRWFDTSAFAAPTAPALHFGSLGRNVVIGPGFHNIDFSVLKKTAITERLRTEFRAEIFDLFNHANFGQPGRVFGTPTFGQITNTRFPTSDSGSSRQLQFAVKLIF
jgi:Carboxypeptidase regulatory-like domain/TonB dependent receptor